jgi:hypothetical protein
VKDADLLLTIAEVAVAFAGFASLVSVLGRRYSRDDPRLDGLRLRGMLLSSLIVVAFALFPFLPMRFGVTDAEVWRISSGTYFATNALLVLPFARRTRRLAQEGVGEPPSLYLFYFVVEVVVSTLLVVVALGFFPRFASSFYITGLFVGLSEAGITFFRVVSSLTADSGP